MGSGIRGRTIVLLAFSGFVATGNLRMMDSLLPNLSADFGVTVGQASWAIGATAIGYGLSQVGVGVIGDRFGKYRVIMTGCFASSVAALLCALALSIGQLVAARALLGAVASGIVALALAWIGDTVAMENRQAVMARYITGSLTGGLLSPAIAGALADRFGWRSAILAYAIGFFVAGLMLAIGGRRERAAPIPTEPGPGLLVHVRSLARSPYARTIFGGVIIESVSVFSVMSFAGASLHQRFGISLGTVGAVLASFAIGGFAYTFLASSLLRRFTQAQLVLAGGFLGASGIVALGAGPWLWPMPFSLFVFGLGFYLIHSALQVHATQILPTARGTGISLFASSFFLAQSLGVSLAAPVVDAVGILPVCLTSATVLICLAFWLSAKLRSWTTQS